MKIHYVKTVYDKICEEVKKSKKKIDFIELTPNEWDELVDVINITSGIQTRNTFDGYVIMETSILVPIADKDDYAHRAEIIKIVCKVKS